MYIKAGLVALAASAVSAYTVGPQGYQQQQGMTQANEYAIRNMDEICVSTRPVQMCEQEFVVKSFKNEKVNFHCVSRNSLEGQRFKQQVENDQVIPEMQGKTVHIQGRVQVPTRCVEKTQVNGQEARRREFQQQHGQRVQLIEDEQQFDQENQWDQEEDQLTNEEQYNQYRKNRFHEEKEWQKMQTLFQTYPELAHKKLHQIVKADEGKYQQVAQQLKELVNQKQVTSHLMPQIQQTLPTYFSEVAKQLYEAMQEQRQQNKQQQQQHHRSQDMQQLQNQEQYRLPELVGEYQEYTDVMKRVYVYIVKEALKLNQQSPRRLANTPELIRKVWEKTRQELTKRQIEKTDQLLEQVQELLELDQTNQLIVDELVSEQLKTSSKQARRNLMRIIVSGLMMKNSPIFEQHY